MKKKWLAGLLSVVLVVCAVFGVMSTVAYAAISNVDYNGVILNADTTGAWSGSVSTDYYSFTGKASYGSWFSKQSSSMTITNNNDATVTVVIEYTYDGEGELSITKTAGSTVTTLSGTKITESLSKGDYITIKLTSESFKAADLTGGKLTVSTAEERRTLNLSATEYGSYEVTVADGDPVTVSNTESTVSYTPVDEITVTPIPADGYQLYRITIGGTVYSVEDLDANGSIKLLNLVDQSDVEVEFLPDTYQLAYKVGGSLYYCWEDAMADAKSSGNVVILVENYTLPASLSDASGEKTGTYVTESNGKLVYEVPSGVTFLIPYDSSNSTNDLFGDGDYTEGSPSAASPYRTLTVSNGATVNVNGNFVVNAYRKSTTGAVPQGTTSGGYGKVILGGTMNVNSGATLVARGYIVDANHTSHNYGNGTGRLYAKSGSTVKILFQVINHRGGSATVGVKDKVMPINNYTFASIMAYAEYEYGSTIKADYQVVISMFVLGVKSFPGTVTFLSSGSDGLFLMKAASGDVPVSKVIMDYDYANDQTIVVLPQGQIDMANIKLENLGGIGVTVDTAASQLPFADNLKIYIGGYPDGTTAQKTIANVTYSTKMLPGAEINVMGNGTLNIPSDSSMFLYAVTDYQDSWSNNKLRTRLNVSDVSQKNTRVEPTTNATINVYADGVVNVAGEFGQSSNVIDAFKIMGENAHLNLTGEASASTPKTQVYEANSTSDTAVLSDDVIDWTGVKGLLAGISESSTDYELFETEAGIGEYRSALIDGTYYWYKYAVTYNVTVEGGETETITKYLCVDNYTFNPTKELNDPDTDTDDNDKYVITAYTPDTLNVTAGADDPNASLEVKNGWENLVLTGLTGDTTVNLTVKPYDYRVSYTDNGGAAVVEYSEETFTHTWNVAPMRVEAKFYDWTTGSAITVSNDGSKQDGNNTVFTAMLTCDTKIAFTTSADVWPVTWKVTDVSGETSTTVEYIDKGADATYTVDQPDDVWHIIDDGKVTASGTNNGVKNNRTSYTVYGVGSETIVEITLTAYDHQINVALIPDDASDSTSIKVNPYYFDGDSTSIQNTDIISTLGSKYTFKEEAITCEGATVTAAKETLTASNVTARSISFTAYVEKYDSVVTINENGAQRLKDYYASGETVSYSFGELVKIDSCTQMLNGETTSTTFTGYTNPVVNDDGTITKATISFTAGTDDVTLNAKTSSFNHIVKVIDGVADKTVYITDHTYNYTAPDHYYVANATVTGTGASGTLTGIGTENLSVTGITGHPTINVTLQSYATKVTWYNVADNEVLRTTYIHEITDGNGTATYTCGAKQVAWASTYPNGVTVNPDEGETITVSGIKAGNEIRIGLELYDYEYKVQFNDGADGKTVYVNSNSQDVLNANGDVVYSAGKGKYITNYTLSTGAVAIVGSNGSVNTDVTDGWDSMKLTGIGSDVTVDVILGTYDYKVTWNVSASVDGVASKSTHVNYVTGSSDSYTIDSKYTITNVQTDEGSASFAGNVATVTGITDDATVNVTAQDYKYMVTWIVDGVETQQALNEDAVVWTLPDSTDGKTYVIVEAEITVGSGTVVHSNKTVTVNPTSDVTVKIKTEEALTNYTALWGDMSFKYYKNGAFYSWDETAYVWKLIDQYSWTHKSGSRVHSFADLNEADKITTYTVPNGSVMVVNPTNQKITATVTITLNTDAATWQTEPSITLTAEDEAGTTGIGTITVTLDAHSTMIISGTLTGTPANNLTDVVTGSCKVEIAPID